jgi:hypothetical protein
LSGVTYEVTAKFDDGLYRIVDNEWVASERWYRPKTVDFRSAFSLCPLETPEIVQKEHKMDRFKRFLSKFALYFGAYVIMSAVLVGVSAATTYLNSVFGPVAGVIVAVAIFGALVSGGVAWSVTERKG